MKTDKQIQKDVMEELQWDPRLNSAEIGVSVKNGIVTLSGEVDSYSKKISAERAASRIKEVKGIAQEINVKLPSTWEYTDTEIADAAVKSIENNTTILGNSIKVKVEEGWITLEGQVLWEYQKEEASRILQNNAGVVGLTNMITIKPRVKTPIVKEAIKKALERSADIEAGRIEVETKGNEVILSGKVRTWAERGDVERAVWNSPGVTSIKNKLNIG